MCAFIGCLGLSLGHDVYRLGVVMLCSLILLTGCSRDHLNDEHPAYIEVLSDFVFVGSSTYDPKSAPVHGMKEVPLPLQFKAGYQYIFHLRNSEQNADIYKTLLTRLQSRGIKIISSSASLDRYIGGPGFRISFQGDGFKGFIFNALDGQIVNNEAFVRQWSVDDYILVLEEA